MTLGMPSGLPGGKPAVVFFYMKRAGPGCVQARRQVMVGHTRSWRHQLRFPCLYISDEPDKRTTGG